MNIKKELIKYPELDKFYKTIQKENGKENVYTNAWNC